MTRSTLLQGVLTLALALAAALACVWLHTPLPWMLGPLLATAAASMLGARTYSWTPLRNGGQLAIGVALGLYFTPQVVALVGRIWWVIVASIVWSLLLGWLFSLWLHGVVRDRLPGSEAERRATSYYAAAIGGAAEMTLLAERAGARTDLVASAHSLRLLVVTIALPVAITASGWHGVDATLPGARQVAWSGLALLFAAAFAASWLLQKAGRSNPWFLGALFSAMAFTMAGLEPSAMPQVLSNAAQLVIGISLGVRFRAEFVHTAPRWLLAVAFGTAVMLLLCAAFGAALAWLAGLHPATLILGTSPGGIAEMAITAKVLQLGVPVVTAIQVCRVVAVLMLVGPLFQRGWLR
jgi:membrane AbrB-like protein